MHGVHIFRVGTGINENVVSVAGLDYHRLSKGMANSHSSSPVSKIRICALWSSSIGSGLPFTGVAKTLNSMPMKTPITFGYVLANLSDAVIGLESIHSLDRGHSSG